MITKEEFVLLINKHTEWDDKLDQIHKVLKVHPLELDWVEYGAFVFDKLLSIAFLDSAVDDINWWLYEKRGNPTFIMSDENGNEIPTETVEDLWNIVKDFRK